MGLGRLRTRKLFNFCACMRTFGLLFGGNKDSLSKNKNTVLLRQKENHLIIFYNNEPANP